MKEIYSISYGPHLPSAILSVMGKKEHCPIFAKVVSHVYPNYQGKKGTPNNEYN